mmetsp:Transcript_2668/g.3025  ORF Transcript_2668/g.3025 Transcript_2668/m.3025 type:complete len:111 (+) Transcript_2668:144-476(+)
MVQSTNNACNRYMRAIDHGYDKQDELFLATVFHSVAAPNDPIYDPVLDGGIRIEVKWTIGILLKFLYCFRSILRQDVKHLCLRVPDLLTLDLKIRGLSTEGGDGLLQHDC